MAVLVGVDISNACTTIRRDKVIEKMTEHAPEIVRLAQAWLGTDSIHVAPGKQEEGPVQIEQCAGIDQGCPLSPAMYAITVGDALDAVERDMR